MAQATPLLDAIKQNNLRQVKLILESGCDVNETNSLGWTPLIVSLVYLSHSESRSRVIDQLIRSGADVNKTDNGRKCPLTYACSLNLKDTVRHLLEQRSINADLPDRNGVTPLMHAAALGHVDVVQTMMEYQRSGAVSINMEAKDNDGCTATDHAAAAAGGRSGNTVVELLQSYSCDVGAVRCPSPSGDGFSAVRCPTPTGQGNEIELVDMRMTHTKETSQISSDIHAWAEEIHEQQAEAERLSSLRPPSITSKSGAKSDKSRTIPLTETSNSSLSVPGLHYGRLNSPTRLGSRKQQAFNVDEDEEDFSLESLSDLLGTVRQYAKEIREIYAPIQKDKEDRIRKKQEKMERRKIKDAAKQAQGNAEQVFKTGQHEVRVEIHKLEDSLKNKIQGGGRGRVNHSKSHEPSPTHPVASLHVENEQLSSTWPRGRHRSQSQDRFLSETNIVKHSSMKASTSSASSTRPPLPADWNQGINLRHEKDILNKAFQRLNIPSKDPLYDYKKNASNRQLQKQLISSRQSVIEMAKQHLQTRQGPLPSISIIPPPSEQGRIWAAGGVVPSAPTPEDDMQSYVLPSTPTFDSNNESRDFIIPMGQTVADDEKPLRQSKNGGVGVKSSSKVGLRRRKSVEQGLGQGKVLEKY